MRCLLAVLFLLGAASIADARPLMDDEPPPALPASDAALPATADALASEFSATTRALRAAERALGPGHRGPA